MRRTTVSPRQIYAFANEFISSQRQGRYGPGRPKLYDDALIIAIACVHNLYSFSFRETLEFCESQYTFLPVLSAYHYRLQRLPSDTIRKFIEFLGTKIKQETKSKIRLFIVDGTGFSYKDDYPMKFYRGTEIRKIKAHVKVGAIAGVFGKICPGRQDIRLHPIHPKDPGCRLFPRDRYQVKQILFDQKRFPLIFQTLRRY